MFPFMMGGKPNIRPTANINAELLVAHAVSAKEDLVSGSSIGQLFTWKDGLRADDFRADVPLIGALFNINKRPKKLNNIDKWKVDLLVFNQEKQAEAYEVSALRLRPITPEEANEILTAHRLTQAEELRKRIPALLSIDLTRSGERNANDPELNPAGWRRGELMIHEIGEQGVKFTSQIATFVGIGEDRDPIINLLINADLSTTYKNPSWSGWRRMTAEEVEQNGGTKEMVESYMARQALVTRGGPLGIANDPKPVEAEVVEAAA